MASSAELMALGVPWLVAQQLGEQLSPDPIAQPNLDPLVDLVATGSSQVDGFQITSSYSQFGTVDTGAAAVLPLAIGQGMQCIFNNGPGDLTLFCAPGEMLNMVLNGAIIIESGKSALVVPHVNQWIANISEVNDDNVDTGGTDPVVPPGAPFPPFPGGI